MSPVSSPELAVSYRSHLAAMFAQGSWSGLGHLRKNGYCGKKILQALSFLLICDLHVFTSFSRKIFPCAFTLCFKHTEFTGSKDSATQG